MRPCAAVSAGTNERWDIHAHVIPDPPRPPRRCGARLLVAIHSVCRGSRDRADTVRVPLNPLQPHLLSDNARQTNSAEDPVPRVSRSLVVWWSDAASPSDREWATRQTSRDPKDHRSASVPLRDPGPRRCQSDGPGSRATISLLTATPICRSGRRPRRGLRCISWNAHVYP